GSFLKRFNSVESIASSFISEYFRGTFMFDYYDVYDKITIGYANKLLSAEFDPQNIAMSVVYPI
ncbi:MAG TPA: peptidase M16, partial [Clostridia bacterium]|nr:peptidase M16 [Clostridia bacterium]